MDTICRCVSKKTTVLKPFTMQNGYNMQVRLLVNNGINNPYNTTYSWSVIDNFLIKR